jgi:hypothetical protein
VSATTRHIPIFRTERTLVLVLAVIGLVPVLYVLARAFLVSRNVAYWDELDTVLNFILRLKQSSTWQAAAGQLFELGNEHRTFTSRLLFALSYVLTGTVNFVVIGAIGNLFICALCGVLIYYAGTTVRRVTLGVVLAFCLFQLEHYENFQWSGSSIDHFQIVLLAGVCVIGLSRQTRVGWLVGIAFAFLASFTLAHGLLLWPVGVLLLAEQRRWRRLALWSVVAIVTALIFFHDFQFNTAHKIGTLTDGTSLRLLRYWLTLLGAPLALGESLLAPVLGVVMLALLGRAVLRRAHQPDHVPLALAVWSVGALLLVAVGRAEVAQGHVYSRYYVLGALAWALVIFLELDALRSEAAPYRPILYALPALAVFNVAADRVFDHDAKSWVICRDNAAYYYMEFGRDGMGRFTLFPDPAYATRLLRDVEIAGVYRMPTPCQPRVFPQEKPATNLAYYIDRITVNDETIRIEGWAARPGFVSAPGQIHVILLSDRSRTIYTTVPMQRPDVDASEPREDWHHSGFRLQCRHWALPRENFQIGIMIVSDQGAEFVMTAHRLDLTGPGVGILAGSE